MKPLDIVELVSAIHREVGRAQERSASLRIEADGAVSEASTRVIHARGIEYLANLLECSAADPQRLSRRRVTTGARHEDLPVRGCAIGRRVRRSKERLLREPTELAAERNAIGGELLPVERRCCKDV